MTCTQNTCISYDTQGAFHPGAQFSVFTLVYVKHRALPPLNYFLRALAAPGIR